MEKIAVLTRGGDCPGMNHGQIKVSPPEYAWKGKKKIDLGFCHLSQVMAT
jgi:hypothetical protein